MTTRATRIIAVLCALFVFVATATVLNSWPLFLGWIGNGLSVALTIIGEAVR
jgi:hypothetical protein